MLDRPTRRRPGTTAHDAAALKLGLRRLLITAICLYSRACRGWQLQQMACRHRFEIYRLWRPRPCSNHRLPVTPKQELTWIRGDTSFDGGGSFVFCRPHAEFGPLLE